MDLSIVIVNWNSADYTVRAVESVTATANCLDHEILIVDNASTDDSLARLASRLPRTTTIPSPTNLGFARACNLAASTARGRALLFLNPDTQALDHALVRLLGVLDASPSVAIAGARLLNEDLTIQTSCVQPFPTILNQTLDTDWLRRLLPRLSLWGTSALLAPPGVRAVDVEATSGACLMIRRDVFEQLGGFDERYFLYAEDVDLCDRVRHAGYRVCHVPGAIVLHHGGRSSTRQPDDAFAAVLQRESIYRLLRKVRGPRYAARYRGALSAAAIARIALLAAAALLPTGRRRAASSLRKWRRILRWTLGREPWVERLAPLATSEVPA